MSPSVFQGTVVSQGGSEECDAVERVLTEWGTPWDIDTACLNCFDGPKLRRATTAALEPPPS